jgi:hypothetical protein
MLLTHDLGQSIELRKPALETPLWRYVYGGKPKPFFHPLATPAGHILSLFEPSDHVWHRGLWYTIKFINGENFWEEKAGDPWGTQQTPVPPDVSHETNGRILIASSVKWVTPGGTTIVNEKRSFTHHAIDQDAYALDFTFDLTFTADVTLDRTPFTTWGGYGGLTMRGNRNWLKTRLLFDDNTTSDRPTPKPSKWCDLTGLIDGARETQCGIATFDHPSNPRHPTPWYGGTGPGHYYCAAFLFNEPMKLAAGQTLSQRYRVIVHDHEITADRLNALYADYVRG